MLLLFSTLSIALIVDIAAYCAISPARTMAGNHGESDQTPQKRASAHREPVNDPSRPHRNQYILQNIYDQIQVLGVFR
jgi:hypothetical protein